MLNTATHLSLPRSLAELVAPVRATLLVYDMQVAICRQVAAAPEIIARSVELVAAARARGLRIAYTRHLSWPRPWLGATATRTAMRWQRQTDPDQVSLPFGRNAAASAIVPELAPAADDLVIDKYAMSAFAGTPLAMALRDCGQSTVIVCGIATEVGIDPTLRHAADLGFVPVMVTDACGAGNDAAAEHALAALRHAGDTVMVTVAELVSAFEEGTR